MSDWTGPNDPVESLYWHYLNKPNEKEWSEKKFPSDHTIKVSMGSGRKRKRLVIEPGKVYSFSFFDKTNEENEYNGIHAYWTGEMMPQGSLVLIEATINNPTVYYVFPDEFTEAEQIKLHKDEVIVESTCYVLIKVKMKHRKGDEPNFVMDGCNYNITFDGHEAIIIDTEMVEFYDKHPDN